MGHVLREEYLYHGNCKCCKLGHCAVVLCCCWGVSERQFTCTAPCTSSASFFIWQCSPLASSQSCHHPAPKFWNISLTLTFQIQLSCLGNLSWGIFKHMVDTTILLEWRLTPTSRTRKAREETKVGKREVRRSVCFTVEERGREGTLGEVFKRNLQVVLGTEPISRPAPGLEARRFTRLQEWNYFLSYAFLSLFGHAVQPVESRFSNLGWKLCPLH